MKKRFLTFLVLLLVSSIFLNVTVLTAETTESKEKTMETPEELRQLHAMSACLMDASSGRVLFEKNAIQEMPMASTTKIMTAILVLENTKPDDIVTVSKKASIQPDVQLNIKEGEQYKAEDLLYSLMLESHNDTAVALAEHVGGSTDGFARMMNEKAEKLGCKNTYFITPNGLDASAIDKNGNAKDHSTTAIDLAKIMRYCIMESPEKEDFLKITRTAQYTFSDMKGTRTFSCNNHNALLNMMDGALSGKTGFTGKAGYCYIGAVRNGDRTFIVSLLACGWPNNKTYKWSDTKKLMKYGFDNYSYHSFDLGAETEVIQPITVENGQTDQYGTIASVPLQIVSKDFGMLMKSEEKIEVECKMPRTLKAPVAAKQKIGVITYSVNNKIYKTDAIVTAASIAKISYGWCLKQLLEEFFP